jgi:hypothetical protein
MSKTMSTGKRCCEVCGKAIMCGKAIRRGEHPVAESRKEKVRGMGCPECGRHSVTCGLCMKCLQEHCQCLDAECIA